MFKKLAVIIGFLSLVTPVYAAFDDVTFTADATFSVGGFNLTIRSGSKVASFTIQSGSIVFNMENGSVAYVTSADKITLSNSQTPTGCHSEYSYATLSSSVTETITVTPNGGRAPCYGGGGGSGGGVTITATTTATTTVATAPATTTLATTSVAITPTAPVVIPPLPQQPTASDIQNVFTALLNQVAYIKANLTTPNVLTLLKEIAARAGELKSVLMPSEAIPPGGSYTQSLSVGSSGEDVTALQNFLKSQGQETYPEGLVTGYFGPLTQKAVGRFQLKRGVVPDENDSGYGFVGPKTREEINQLLGF